MWGAPRCAPELASVEQCKGLLGYLPRECYDARYDGSCDSAEVALKRCLAFSACRREARVVYDDTRPRAARVEANAALQVCLRRSRALPECTPRAP